MDFQNAFFEHLVASVDRHYHPLVANRLRMLLAARDWQAIPLYLDTLSNAQFRTAGYMLGEMLMPELPEDDFWTLAQTLVSYNSKAFLVTLLKSVGQRDFDVESKGFVKFCKSIKHNQIDTQKLLLNLLPILRHPNEIVWLFKLVGLTDYELRIPYLIRTVSMPASYVLFHTLKYMEHDRALLIRTVCFLIKRGDDKSFNFASILKSYFGLDEVKGTFSLSIEPYQLARLEGSYEAFCQALNR